MMKKISSITLLLGTSAAFALQGGPTQPDYIEFEPSEMKDMVSLTSGNFSYSIPLGEVPSAYGSYPLSISYHAGISPQKEATWVGLGWTLSPGGIIRDLRGVPDDQFHGGTLGFVYQYSALYAWRIDTGYSNGVFSVGLSASNLGGVGASATVGMTVAGCVDIGFKVSTDQGVGVTAGIGYGGVGLNASAMYSPRSGDWTLGAGVSAGGDNVKASAGVQYTTGQGVAYSVGMSVGSDNIPSSLSASIGSDGASISAGPVSASLRKGGTSVSLGPVSVSVANSSSKGGSKSSSTGFSIVVPTNVGVFSLGFNQTLHETRMRAATSDYVYGYMYQGGPAIMADGSNNIDDIPDAQTGSALNGKRGSWDWTYKGRTMETLGEDRLQPAYDMFTIESEGVAGTFRAFPREEQQMFSLVSNRATQEKEKLEFYNPILNLDDNRWPHKEDFKYNEDGSRIASDYAYYKANPSLDAPFAAYKTQFRNEGNRMVYRSNKDSDEPLTSGINFLFLGEGGYYESEDFEKTGSYGAGKVTGKQLKRVLSDANNPSKKIEYALYGSRRIEPVFEDENDPVSKLKGFVITNSNGTKYFFTQPVKSYLKVDYTINQEKGTPVFVDKKMSKYAGFWSNFGEAVVTLLWPPKLLRGIKQAVTGTLEDKCSQNDPADEKILYSYQVNMNPYATQWLLTEIQGPDYIQLDKKNNDIANNIGYNVRFHYTKPSLYQWRSPYVQPYANWNDLLNFRIPRNGLTPEGCDTKMYQAGFGVKEYVYLESIETATHKVKFELNDPSKEERVDGKGWYFNKRNKQDEKTLPILTIAAIGLDVKSVKNETVENVIVVTNEKSKKRKDYYLENTDKTEPIKNWHEAEFEYDALYVNVEIPELLQAELKKNPELTLETDYLAKFIHVDDDNLILLKSQELALAVDNKSSTMIEKTKGDETKFGLYKIKLKKGDRKQFYWQDNSTNHSLFSEAQNGGVKIVLGQNGLRIAKNSGKTYELKQCDLTLSTRYAEDGHTYLRDYYAPCNKKNDLTPPLLDWSDIVFSEDYSDPSKNQMRYLKKIAYYDKKNSDPYREYNFEYDYSLHPRTLNSYCKSKYPEEALAIQDSPLNASTDVCSKESGKYFYGKLTLKSITEKGCQNGRCSTLPPFKFDYNVASQTSTRYSVRNSWMEHSLKNTSQPQKNKNIVANSSSSGNSSSSVKMFFSEDYYASFTDLDASVVATNNSIDEWGFWNIYGSEYNHKVNMSFADYGAAAWSLNKITDPAGGVMEIKYERDEYKNGEDHANERLTVSMYRVGRCGDYFNDLNDKNFRHIKYTPSDHQYDSRYDDKTCAIFFPLYWHDQCLGPVTAYWDYEVPKGHKGGKYDYMDSLGLIKNGVINHAQTMYFKLNTELSTEVDCGVGGWFECDRYRQVGVFGSATVIDKYDGKAIHLYSGDLPFAYQKEFYDDYVINTYTNVQKEARMLVFDLDYEWVKVGVQKAADKMTPTWWEYIYTEGRMWPQRGFKSIKGGDLRVKSLVRYDIDRIAKTDYEYEPGEMAQLPDSAYTTVMGNGFNTDQYSFSLPSVNLNPKSRIVGFEDDDLLYVPGSNVMYPKVTVKNSDDKETTTNGKTVFEYITPEKGIPGEFIDPETRGKLKPFIRVNANLLTWGGYKIDEEYRARPSILTYKFFECSGKQVGDAMDILMLPNRTTSFSFYNDNVKNVCLIGVSYKEKDNPNEVEIKKLSLLEGFNEIGHFNDFNEVMLTVAYFENEWVVHPAWYRTMEQGYYPILYKEVAYDNEVEEIELDEVSEKDKPLAAQKIKPHFEKSIVYHDFTAFLGMNTKISTYRGNDDKAVLLKVDSNVYSTKVPDVLPGIAEGTDVAEKIGKQVERWNSKRELQCAYGKKESDDVAACRRGHWSLGVHAHTKAKLKDPNKESEEQNIYYYQDNVSFAYKRYPVFQIKSLVSNGFDNQEKQFDKPSSSSSSSLSSSSSICDARCERNNQRRHWTVMENHKYDPVTSNPTATLARIPAENNMELHKLTVKLPHHAVLKSGNGEATDLSSHLFKKNMLSLNYADFVYFDSKPVNSSTSWDNLEKVEYLKSFSMNPLNRFNGNLKYTEKDGKKTQVESSKYPYIEWGSFATKKEPKDIIGSANNPYAYVASFQDVALGTSSEKWPNKAEFSGDHILQVDNYFRPLETMDILNRRLSAHYSDNGLRQIGIFFPAELSKTASIVPVGDEINEINLKNSLKNNLKVDFAKGGMVAKSAISLKSSTFNCSGELVAEYRVKKSGMNWQTVRENISNLNLSLKKGDVLNYLRVYPENAEAKTYLYDRYGNMIQVVGEDNVSTFYEYNPLGQLIQTRNDDGVSFKSHHREFTNDDRDEIPWTKNNSSSSGN
jgi:hypothetical protein